MKRVYGVAIRKGGQGKSTTVSTLARLCAQQGARVLVVDLAQPGSTTTSFRDLWPDVENVDFSHCLLRFRDIPPDASADPVATRETLIECGLPVRLKSMPSWGTGSISILPHDETLAEAAAYLQSDRILAGLLELLSDGVDVAIVDFPGDGGALMASALAATQRVIMPLASEAPALEGADATLRLLARARRAGLDISLGGILLTRCDPRNKRAADIVRTLMQSGEVEGEALRHRLFPFAIRWSEFYEQAFRYGVPVWERTDDASHWAGYALLAIWLLRDAGLEHLTTAPRLQARLDPETRILSSQALGAARSEVPYSEYIQAHTSQPA